MSTITPKNRKFGCEFEFSTDWLISYNIIKPIITSLYGKDSLKAKQEWFKSNNNYRQWHFKTDSTTACELCTPISTYKKLNKILKVIKNIKLKNIKVSKKDALHVHLDASDLDPKKILLMWLKYEKVIFNMFPKHRQNNMYCPKAIKGIIKNKLVANYFKEAEEGSKEHHYAISFYFYKTNKKNAKRNTVEIRIAEGTTDYKFVKNWIIFCLYFVEASKKCDIINTMCDSPKSYSLNDLILELKIKDQTLTKWLKKRYEKYKNKQNSSNNDSNYSWVS